MTSNKIPPSDRSINVQGSITGSAVITGDNNLVSVEYKQASLPQPEAVDIQIELEALRTIFTSFNDPITNGIAQKLEEENQASLDKNVITTTLEMGLNYAKNLSGFANAIDQLRPHIEAAAGWLGKSGYKLLPLVGLTL